MPSTGCRVTVPSTRRGSRTERTTRSSAGVAVMTTPSGVALHSPGTPSAGDGSGVSHCSERSDSQPCGVASSASRAECQASHSVCRSVSARVMSGTTPWRPHSIPAYRRNMPDAVIVDAVRTPIGKRRGSLADVHPVDLSAVVLTALAERTGVDPELVDDVLWGCVNQVGRPGLAGRPLRRARGGLARDGARGHDQPRVRLEPELVRLRGGHGDERAVRPGRGGRGRVDDARAARLRPRLRQPLRPARARALQGRPDQRRVPRRRLQPGHRRRAHRPPVAPLPPHPRRVRQPLARAGRGGHRPRRLRRAARPGARRARLRRRRGPAPRHHARDARQAQALVPGGRGDPRGQRVADLRRGLRGAHGLAGARRRAGAHADRALPRRRGERRRPARDAHRADPGHGAGAEALRALGGRHRRRSR